MLRVGVIGCGVVHGTHCEALGQIEGAELAGVYDVVPERALASADKYGVLAASSLEALFDVVDIVNICVPSGLHAEIGLHAARAGKHVLCEKPIDVTYEKALRLVEGCEAHRVKLGVISQHRFATDMRKLHVLASEGSFGRLLQGDCYNKWYRSQNYYDSGDWRGTVALDGGGCLMNQGVHYIDMIQWVMGGVKSVQAQVRTAAHERIEVEDIANALVEYKNGAVGVIQGSTSFYPGMAERLEVHGVYGSAVIEGDRMKFLKIDAENCGQGLYGDGVNKQPTPSVHLHGEGSAGATGAADPTAAFGMQHQLQIQDFVEAVADGRDPYLTGRAALEPLKIILAIYESGRKGGARVEIA
ncbi:MAG: Gfo/Idh/MocA family protein [Fimbriimonadaceae bacterium]